MEEDLEALTREHLDGTLDASGRARLAELLERDPNALGEFVDQLQIHHRLGAALRPEAGTLADSVLRELRLLGDSPRFSREVVDRLKQETRPARRGRLWEAIAACLALAVLAFFLFGRRAGNVETPGRGAAPRPVLFVVGHVPLGPGDSRAKERLEKLGCAVTVKIDRAVAAADAQGKALVAISSTSQASEILTISGELTAKFRDSSIPVLVWEPRLFYDFGMIAGAVHQTDWAAARAQTHLLLTDAAHPLAAGRSGRVQVTARREMLSWGRVRPDAIRIATLETDPSRAAIFAYDRGAAMPGLVAPARRVGFFLFDTTATELTGDGWALFDAAVRWCLADSKL